VKKILEYLRKNSDEKYKIFNKRIVNTKQQMIGVRVPILRKLAKQIIKENPYDFISKDKQNIYELVLLEGFVISYLDIRFKDVLPYLKDYLSKVDSWAQIDSMVCSLKSIKDDKDFVYKIVKQWLKSNEEFTTRIALVILLTYFVEKRYLNDIFELSLLINNQYYYVMMANAWLISVCMIKYPKETKKFLKLKRLDKVIQNKAIQKSCDSYQVLQDDKDELKNIKV